MVGVQARKEQVLYATQRGLSQRRACTLVKISRSSMHYRYKKPLKDIPIMQLMREASSYVLAVTTGLRQGELFGYYQVYKKTLLKKLMKYLQRNNATSSLAAVWLQFIKSKPW